MARTMKEDAQTFARFYREVDGMELESIKFVIIQVFISTFKPALRKLLQAQWANKDLKT
ncbi:MAG: hypothetical protein ACTSU5_20890 [Promethearchaeota archaeon]